jgi:hypothetical protein
MVISPLLRGLFGLQTDALNHRVSLAPHVPADWTAFAIRHVRTGDAVLDFSYRKTLDEIALTVKSSGDSIVEFSPAVSPRAQVIGAEIDGRRASFRVKESDFDQHVIVQATLKKGESVLRIRLRNDFGIGLSPSLPPLGSRRQGLRVLSESWSAANDVLTLDVSGAAGLRYELSIWNPGTIASVDGAELKTGKLQVQIPSSDSDPYPHKKITVHFVGRH